VSVSEAQYLTFLLGFAATIAAILIALLVNNARLNDAKDALRAEIKAGDSAILAQMATYQMDMISKLAELDNRITRLER
jgi:hypothetical protein